MGVRALLIEDDAKLAELTAEFLRARDVTVNIVEDGESGLEAAMSSEHDIILLDLMLPGMGGLEVCRQLRRTSDVPLIILSARGDEVDKVVGLELGADDYLAKPYSPRELLARMNAVIRRRQPTSREAETATAGPLEIDRGRHIATVHGSPLELTAHQFDVLWVLTRAPDQVLPRKEIYRQVRELQDLPVEDFDPSIDRSVDVHLSKIRQALDRAAPGQGAIIRTIRGVGYVLDLSRGGDDG